MEMPTGDERADINRQRAALIAETIGEPETPDPTDPVNMTRAQLVDALVGLTRRGLAVLTDDDLRGMHANAQAFIEQLEADGPSSFFAGFSMDEGVLSEKTAVEADLTGEATVAAENTEGGLGGENSAPAGDPGADTIIGGDGEDTLMAGDPAKNAPDVVLEPVGDDTATAMGHSDDALLGDDSIPADAGLDTITSAGGDTLAGSGEAIQLEAATDASGAPIPPVQRPVPDVVALKDPKDMTVQEMHEEIAAGGPKAQANMGRPKLEARVLEVRAAAAAKE